MHISPNNASQTAHPPVVTTEQTDRDLHGLHGKRSNNAATRLQSAFIHFVINNRTVTGRTRDEHGRFHGCEYHLSVKFLAIRKQTRKGRNNPPDGLILSEVFLKHAKKVHKFPDADLVSGNTVDLWFRKLFGIRSPEDHTEHHPHKSDACPTCFHYDEDIKSTQMSINRHEMQPDQTPERQAVVA